MKILLKNLDKRWGPKRAFWILVVVFVVLFLLLGSTIVWRGVRYDTYWGRGMMYQTSTAPSQMMNVRTTDREIVRSASLSLLVETVEQAINSISSSALNSGGFVEYATAYDVSDGVRGGRISIRVPKDSFNQTLQAIKAMAVKVETQTVNSEDETQLLLDYGSRISSLKDEQKQFKAILSKATKVDDILKIQEALRNVETNLSILESERDYIVREAAMGRITVSLVSEKNVKVLDHEWSISTTIDEGLKSLNDDLLDFSRIALLVLLALPVLIFKLAILALVLYVLWKVLERLKKELK